MTEDESTSPPARISLPREIHERLRKRFDVDALEELLSIMPASDQMEILRQLGASGEREAETTNVIVPMRSTDPVRQTLLDRIWAPFWSHLPPDALDLDDLPYPGREIARARRSAETTEQP